MPGPLGPPSPGRAGDPMCPSERMLPVADPLWICCLAVTGPNTRSGASAYARVGFMYSLPAHPPRICKRKVWEGGLLSWQMSASTSRPEWRGWAGKDKLPSLAEGLLRGEATNGACGLAENRNINSGTPNSHKVSLARNNEDDRQRPSCRALRSPPACGGC